MNYKRRQITVVCCSATCLLEQSSLPKPLNIQANPGEESTSQTALRSWGCYNALKQIQGELEPGLGQAQRSSDVTTLPSVEMVVHLITLNTQYGISSHYQTRALLPKALERPNNNQPTIWPMPLVKPFFFSQRGFNQKVVTRTTTPKWLAESHR